MISTVDIKLKFCLIQNLIYCHQKRYVIGCYDYFGESFGRRFSLHNDDLRSEEGSVLLLQYLHHQNI